MSMRRYLEIAGKGCVSGHRADTGTELKAHTLIAALEPVRARGAWKPCDA